jgi:predicted DNA-binding WGR domain protein
MLPRRLVYISPRENSFKFYCLELSRSMFDEIGLLKKHGRLGTPGQQVFWRFPTERDALAFARRKVRAKLAAGYVEAFGADWRLPLQSLLRQLKLNEERCSSASEEEEESFDSDCTQFDLFVKYDRMPARSRTDNVIELDPTLARTRPVATRLASVALTDCLLTDRAATRVADSLYDAGLETVEQLNSISDVRLAELTRLELLEAAEFRRKVTLGARAFLGPAEIADFQNRA